MQLIFLILEIGYMINVLITGSRGFLGTALRTRLLKELNVKVLEFGRADTDELLHQYIKIADFIFHFAGEVRPKSSDKDFISSNNELTAKLISFLCSENKKTPIILTSTIHAVNPKNIYGETKLASELLIDKYTQEQTAPAWIYRLPHVFGPGCKPNYNSVLSTWIYNSINNLDIHVFDRDIKMNYCYSEELINYFMSHLKDETEAGCFYVTPHKIYNTELGNVADLINSFKGSIISPNIDFVDDSFEEKLYLTYQSYVTSDEQD